MTSSDTKTTSDKPFLIKPVRTTEADYLLHLSDALMNSLYPAESNHLISPEDVRAKAMVFLGGFCGETCVACVALMPGHKPGYAEVKRLFVADDYRGHGYARQLMHSLDKAARKSHITCLQLETGIYQPASHALYRGLGYHQTAPFGSYKEDPLSVFFEKQLD